MNFAPEKKKRHLALATWRRNLAILCLTGLPSGNLLKWDSGPVQGVPFLPNPTTRKGWPPHRGLRPLFFTNSDVASFTSHKNKSVVSKKCDLHFSILIKSFIRTQRKSVRIKGGKCSYDLQGTCWMLGHPHRLPAGHTLQLLSSISTNFNSLKS